MPWWWWASAPCCWPRVPSRPVTSRPACRPSPCCRRWWAWPSGPTSSASASTPAPWGGRSTSSARPWRWRACSPWPDRIWPRWPTPTAKTSPCELEAVALIVLDLKLGGVQHWAQDLRDRLSTAVTESGRQPSRGVLVNSLDRVLKINKHGFPVLIVTAIAYCVVEGVEAVGLWLERR